MNPFFGNIPQDANRAQNTRTTPAPTPVIVLALPPEVSSALDAADAALDALKLAIESVREKQAKAETDAVRDRADKQRKAAAIRAKAEKDAADVLAGVAPTNVAPVQPTAVQPVPVQSGQA